MTDREFYAVEAKCLEYSDTEPNGKCWWCGAKLGGGRPTSGREPRTGMDAYELETIQAIRGTGSRLCSNTNREIKHLYQEWSNTMSCAGWLMWNEESIKGFIRWATMAPCNRKET